MEDYILVTGAAGFIGFHFCKHLLMKGYKVIGFDNFNSYYDPSLKRARINELIKLSKNSPESLKIIEGDLKKISDIEEVFVKFKPSIVYNLAAQAGVRYSLINPNSYIQSNLVGFCNILEFCKKFNVNNLIYASSSSVYGGSTKLPFSEFQSVDHPISLYAATKRSNELMAHTYSHLFNLPSTGLRFFTVYGPWGRPDMALFLFTKAILENKPIKIFNNGKMKRDFTYIDDIVESLFRLLVKPATPDANFSKDSPKTSTSWAPHRIFNIGNSQPTPLMDYIEAIENELGIEAKKEFYPIQPGDVEETFSNNQELEKWINFKPNTSIKKGVSNFIRWYKDFYKI